MKIIMIEWECLDCGLVQQDKFKSQNQEIFCFKCKKKKQLPKENDPTFAFWDNKEDEIWNNQ
ncbi:hypothetical protein LCGC14_2085500 [marine sediment metagenome]|uniref:Uncharacterized protein n=1 Tax=marine sediment metagenome TaxID=412755 RepID=A0A0F9EE78_9ZZZZ